MADLPSIEELFPTHGAIKEPQQIGRTRTIEDLADRVRDRSDALLLHPRKEGKSSVAGAAMARIAAEGGIVADADCTSADVRDGPSLARAILESVQSQGVQLSRLLEARAGAARQKGRLAGLRKATSAAEEAGIESERARVFSGVLDALSSAGSEPSLEDILGHLAQLGEEQTAGLFLDELQEIAKWKDTVEVQEALARFMRHSGRKVAVVVAGSEQSAIEALFAEGQPLHWEFEAFDLPPIDRVDWHEGIHGRFKAAGYQIAAGRIDQILESTEGQPLRTMTVAKQALRETRDTGESEVTWAAVTAAIETASRHPSWNT